MSWWNTLLEPVTNLISKPIEQWGDRKKVKLEGKVKIEHLKLAAVIRRAEAEIEKAKAGMVIESDWDARAQEQAKFSWKDEVLMVIMFFPIVLLFISAFFTSNAFQLRVIASVNALGKFPLWYVVLICGIIAAVFGLRWLVAPLVTKLTKGKSVGKTCQKVNGEGES